MILEDFSLELFIAMIKKAGIFIREAGMNIVYEIVNYLDALGIDYTYQLCL